MHKHGVEQWQHNHDFTVSQVRREKKTTQVLALTTVMMAIEIVTGYLYGSLALLADGWHMATHSAAFLITLFAYRYQRRHARNSQFTFGTGKVNALGGFANAVALAVVALMMAIEAIARLISPHEINFRDAIIVASLGLAINLISAFLLQEHHHHGHDDHDHNLQAAYMHVIADAMTSILAITALIAGKTVGWVWLDPIMGIVGGLVILKWSWGLLKHTSSILLDRLPNSQTKMAIINAVEEDADNQICDLHLWQIGSNRLAVIISVVTHEPKSPEHYKNLLVGIPSLSHVSVEVNPCREPACLSS